MHIGLLRLISTPRSSNALYFHPVKTEKYVATRSRLAVDTGNAYQILKMKNAGHVQDVKERQNFVMEDVCLEDASLPHVRGPRIVRTVAAHVHNLQWKQRKENVRAAAILKISNASARAALSNNLLFKMQLHVRICPVHNVGSVLE